MTVNFDKIETLYYDLKKVEENNSSFISQLPQDEQKLCKKIKEFFEQRKIIPAKNLADLTKKYGTKFEKKSGQIQSLSQKVKVQNTKIVEMLQQQRDQMTLEASRKLRDPANTRMILQSMYDLGKPKHIEEKSEMHPQKREQKAPETLSMVRDTASTRFSCKVCVIWENPNKKKKKKN